MNHPVRQSRQPPERGGLIQVALQGHATELSPMGGLFRATHQHHHPPATRQVFGHALCHIATAHHQQARLAKARRQGTQG